MEARIQLFQQSISIDSTFSESLAELARSSIQKAQASKSGVKYIQLAKSSLDRAVDLNSETLNVINSGIGYTGPFTYTGVALTTVTGSGRNATADIQVAIDGTVGFATIVAGGTGYEVGDTLGVTTIGTNNLGTALRLSVSSIGSTSSLILE